MDKRITFFLINFFIIIIMIGCLDIQTPTGDLSPPTGLSINYDEIEEKYLTLNWYLIPDTQTSVIDIYDGVNIYYVEYGTLYNGTEINTEVLAYDYFVNEWSLLYDEDGVINQDVLSNTILYNEIPSISGSGVYDLNGDQLSHKIYATSLGIEPTGGNEDAIFTDEKYYFAMTTVGDWGGVRLESPISNVVLFDYSLSLN